MDENKINSVTVSFTRENGTVVSKSFGYLSEAGDYIEEIMKDEGDRMAALGKEESVKE